MRVQLYELGPRKPNKTVNSCNSLIKKLSFLPVIPIRLPVDFTIGFTGGLTGFILLFSAKKSIRDNSN